MEYSSQFLREVIILALQYEKKGNVIDERTMMSYVNDLALLIKEEKKLGDKLSEITPIYYGEQKGNIIFPATYSDSDKELKISYPQMIYLYHNLEKLFVGKKSDLGFICLLSMIVYHELEHAYQFVLIEQSGDSFETELLKQSLSIFSTVPDELFVRFSSISDWIKLIKVKTLLKKMNRLYSNYHDFAPFERMCNIEAYKFFIDMAAYLRKIELGKAGNEQLLNYYKMGYGLGGYPTATFFEHTNSELASMGLEYVKYVDYEALNESSRELPASERFRMGMELTPDEYKQELGDVIEKLTLQLHND